MGFPELEVFFGFGLDFLGAGVLPACGALTSRLKASSNGTGFCSASIRLLWSFMFFDEFIDLALGIRDTITVCNLDSRVTNILVAQTPRVSLSRESLLHIRKRRPDMPIGHILYLPDTIRGGMIIRDNQKKNHIVIAYQSPDSPRRYVAVLKVAGRGHAIYVQTFYFAKKRQTKSLLARGTLLRAHR